MAVVVAMQYVAFAVNVHVAPGVGRFTAGISAAVSPVHVPTPPALIAETNWLEQVVVVMFNLALVIAPAPIVIVGNVVVASPVNTPALTILTAVMAAFPMVSAGKVVVASPVKAPELGICPAVAAPLRLLNAGCAFEITPPAEIAVKEVIGCPCIRHHGIADRGRIVVHRREDVIRGIPPPAARRCCRRAGLGDLRARCGRNSGYTSHAIHRRAICADF